MLVAYYIPLVATSIFAAPLRPSNVTVPYWEVAYFAQVPEVIAAPIVLYQDPISVEGKIYAIGGDQNSVPTKRSKW